MHPLGGLSDAREKREDLRIADIGVAVALEGGLPVRVNRQVADAGLEALQV